LSLSALPLRRAVAVFLAFGFAYFFSALLRAVTATLAPAFSAELGLSAADLGLLAGAFFFGFASLQLPLGSALDRWGPKPVLLALLCLGVGGCLAFAAAQGLSSLVLARVLIGMGVAACLMAPLTAYRHLFSAEQQLRANSWMLMTGSLGMLASTLPVQWLLPALGWRGLFVACAACLGLAMMLIWWVVPQMRPVPVPPPTLPSRLPSTPLAPPTTAPLEPHAPPVAANAWFTGYAEVFRHPLFLRLLPVGFFSYGGLIAVQALWAGPWMTQLGGASAAQAANGLFIINLCMLLTFAAWGALAPRLAHKGWDALRLMRWGLPLHLLALAWIVARGGAAGAWDWALWCVLCTVVTPSQPALGQAFVAARAGQALSAYNLVIFSGIFCVQWGIGLAIDAFRAAGWGPLAAYRASFAGFGLLCVAAYAWFMWRAPRSAHTVRHAGAATH
jgi:MFS family permease